MKVITNAKINKIIKINPVPIWPRVDIHCKYFSHGKTRENFANTPVNYQK
jgi:hypothetical protein